MNKIWIALSGKAGCGKSTIADILGKDHGFIRLSFAKRMKEICNELFPELMQQDKNSARWVLQRFGTDYCRQIKNNVWVDVVTERIDNHCKEGYALASYWSRIVIDDVRFFNEYFALKNRDFKMVRIIRGDALRAKWGYNVKDSHASETQLDILRPEDWDLIVHNNFEHPFREAVEFIVKSLETQK